MSSQTNEVWPVTIILAFQMAGALTCAALKSTEASPVVEEPQPVSSPAHPAAPAPDASTTSRGLRGVSQALLDRVGVMLVSHPYYHVDT